MPTNSAYDGLLSVSQALGVGTNLPTFIGADFIRAVPHNFIRAELRVPHKMRRRTECAGAGRLLSTRPLRRRVRSRRRQSGGDGELSATAELAATAERRRGAF